MRGETLQARQERANTFWLVSLLVTLLIPLPGLTVAILGPWLRWAKSDLFDIALVPFAVAAWLALGALGLGHLRRKARQEEEDRRLLEQRKRQAAASVFEGEDEYLRRHQRALARYERYAPFGLLAGVIVILAGALAGFWFGWAGRAATAAAATATPGQAAFVALLIALATVFGGIFCLGQSREPEYRWLQAVGAWLTLAALTCAGAGASLVCRYLEMPDGDAYGRVAAFVLLVLLGIELVGNFIVEFYRPRTLGEDRPVFESRLLALFTEPGGVVKNVADTLDYQFGFKASGTWMYRFVERAVIPLLLVWLATLWLLTCLAEVGYGEVGVRERFGKALLDRAPLGPGLYFKLPWPGERLARHPVGQLREIVIGSQVKVEGKDRAAAGTRLAGDTRKYEVVLWTVSHYDQESQYLVAANRSPGTADTTVTATDDVSVSFLSAMLPIQYRIRDIVAFAYRHRDATAALRDLAEREVTNYLASADLLRVMSTGRGEATQILTERLQTAADNIGLGVDIVYVNFHDAHPPIEQVAPSFQAVVGAQEEKESQILAARSYERKTLPEARGAARREVSIAAAYADQVVKVSEAEMERFSRQVLVYRTMPAMFILRTYLDFLERDCSEVRKYVVAESGRDEVFILNLEEKAQLDLISADLSDLREDSK
jgi:regulator of protease activity HflC (stomatin/prohibitin superfamily)